MSNLQTARGRKEWMPNRMFDPVSNPFAIQNLLEKKVETFVEQRDERAEAVFTFDAVVMANPVHAFSEQTIEDPTAGAAPEFQAEWMDAGNAFSGEAPAAAGDFVAGQASAASGFSADGEAGMQEPAGADAVAQSDGAGQLEAAAAAEVVADAAVAPPASDEVVAAMADASASADADAAAQPTSAHEAGTTAASAGDAAVSVVTGAAEASGAAETIDAADTAETPDTADTDLATADVAAATASATEAVAAAPQPALAAAQPGISEEELNARLEAAREEGRAEVRAALADKEPAVRAEARQQGYDEGQAAGYAKAKEELGKDYEAKIAQLQSMLDAMQALSYNPDAMFEPMKTLSVHIAEQLVRGELTQSPQAISRLVDNCLRELNASGEKAVIIHLHPDDIEQYKPQAAQFGDALVLRADPKLERGSVRASLEGSVVEDLIQRRVAGLKKGLMQAPAPSWRANAGRLSERIADGQRGSQQVEDVTIAAARQEADAVTETTATSPDGADA